MNYVYVVFASFATANRVKSLLQKKYNIGSSLMQTPDGINLKSCSYCLKLRYDYADTVWNIICRNGLSSKGIFSCADYVKLR